MTLDREDLPQVSYVDPGEVPGWRPPRRPNPKTRPCRGCLRRIPWVRWRPRCLACHRAALVERDTTRRINALVAAGG